MTPSPSTGSRVPTGRPAATPAPDRATTLAVPSPSSRNSEHSTSPRTFASSSATSANTSAGGRLLGDERRDPPQGGLLLREPVGLGVGLGVGDRRGHQLGELAEAGLGLRRQRLVLRRRPRRSRPTADLPPRWARPRRRGSRSSARSARSGRSPSRSRRSAPAAPSGTPARRHCRLRGNARADGKEVVELTRAGHHDPSAVALVAHHPDLLRAKQLSDLLRDRGEDLRLGRFARDERRDSPQRRLLVGQPIGPLHAPRRWRSRSPRAP